MVWNFLQERHHKDKLFLCLDIGTEAVKTLIFTLPAVSKTGTDKRICVEGSSVCYCDGYGAFDGRDFETDVIEKTAAKAIGDAYQNFVSLRKIPKRNERGLKMKLPTVLSISPHVLKGRVAVLFFKRTESARKISRKEAKRIEQEILHEIQGNIAKKFAQDYGILSHDIHWISSKILERKIDGYQVPTLEGYEGTSIEVRILTTFLPKQYLRVIREISRRIGITIASIVHPAEYISEALERQNCDGIFLDVGGEMTQFFVVKNGIVQHIGECTGGGKTFSRLLVSTLGIQEERARLLKERYARGLLTDEVADKIQEMFAQEQEQWYKSIVGKLQNIKLKTAFVSRMVLFGGGSMLPGMKDILERKGGIQKDESSGEGEVSCTFLHPTDLVEVEDATKNLNLQSVPSLLVCYAAKNI